ncbi:hypothetical protein AeRB84_014552 [Aphanomyces euteiches]|nr:hypothetical protein AeRB84_014552 [Aphanomyces euteiches]
MQNFRAVKKKTSGIGTSSLNKERSRDPYRVRSNLSALENESPAASGTNRRHESTASRSDRANNYSAMSDRRVSGNASMNSTNGHSGRRNNGSNLNPNSGNPSDRPQSNSSGRMRSDIQEPEPSPSSNQYDLIWHQGALALQFTLNERRQITIRQIENLPKETTAGLQSASIGDVLVALNWDDVTTLSPADVQERLNRAELPLTLTFRSVAPRIKRKTSSTQIPPLQPGEFEAMWSTGRLGVVIACDNDGRPVVREYAKESSTDPGVSMIQPLDELIYVNNISLSGYSYEQAITTLRQSQKPMVLRFKRPPPVTLQPSRVEQKTREISRNRETPPSSSFRDVTRNRDATPPSSTRESRRQSSKEITQSWPSQYSISWADGPLGMVLKKNSSNDIFIKELKSRGLAQTHRDVLAEGDVLLSVAGVPTKPLGLTGAVDFLQTVHKPVELIFQRPSPVQDRTPPPSQEYTPSSQNRRTSTKQRTPPPSQERVRQSTMVVLPLPSDEVSNESFISDSIAAKYLSKSSPEVTASAEQSYDLIWHRGKLAVSLRNSSTNHTLIRKITPGEQETTANLDAAKVGDILVAINWDDVTSLSYDKIITRLKNRDFPLTLSFKRMERKKPDTSNATTASEPAALPRGDFEVMWREGKLGVKIHCDPDGRAMVRERTVEVADPDLAKIQAGDELIYVNDLRVKSIGYSEALVHMKKPKPIKLRFRRRQRRASAAPSVIGPQPVEVNLDEAMAASNSPRQSIAEKVVDPSQEGEMYSVEWTGGSLGITLRMNESYEIYIAQLTGKGLSLNYPSMRVGDVLLGVMGVPTTPLGLAGTVDFLKCIQKPAVLTFLRKAVPASQPEVPTKPSTDTVATSTLPQSGQPSPSKSRPPPLDLTSVAQESTQIVVPASTSSPAKTAEKMLSPLAITSHDNGQWPFAHDSSIGPNSVSMPMSPSTQLTVSLRASSVTGVVVMSPKFSTQPLTPPSTPQHPHAQSMLPLSPQANISFGRTSPRATDTSTSSALNEQPPSPTLSVSSEPIVSPVLAPINQPCTPPGTPPSSGSVVISRPVPVKQVDEAQILSKAVEPLTPPSNPHIDPWSKNEAYKVSTVLGTSPGTPTFVLDAPHAVVSPIVAAAIVSPPGTPHAAPFGSVTDQSFEHESTPPSFTNSATSSNPAGNHGWHYDDVDMRYESIADLHDFRNTSNSSFSTPLEGMPTQFYSSPPNTVNKGNANSQLVEPNQFGHNSSVAQSDFAYASANAANQYADLSWDISRENRTPTHNTPTAASSMVPLYSARSESVGSMDSMDICDQMSSASSDFMSSRSLATSDAFASNDGSKPLRFTTVSLDDGEVDIDDDDDSVQQDYSTIAPEDVPVLSMSSTRSMISSISSPPSPVPIPASISNEPVKTLYSVLWRGGPLGLAIKRNKDDEICVKALTGGGLAGMSDIIQAGDVLVQCGTTIVQHFTLAETSKVLKEAKTPVSLVFMRRGLPERPVSSGRMSGTSTFTPDTFTNSYDNLQYLGVSSPGSRDSAMTEDPMMSSRTLNDFTMSSRTPVFMPKRLPSNRHSTVFSIVWEGGPLGIAVTKNSDDENCVMRLTGDGLAAQSTIIQVGDVLVAAGDMQVSKLSLTAALQVIQLARKPTFLVFRRGGGADEDV